MGKRRKPRRLVEEPHRFLSPDDTAQPRPDGYMARRGWVIQDRRPNGRSYWVADCPVVGCDCKVTLSAIVCGSCNFTDERRIPVDWMMWWYRKMNLERYVTLMEACFEPDEWELVEPAVEGWR